jgi:GxxExxY protein
LKMKHNDMTEKIIGAAYRVYNDLGFGFLENVYRNAMMHEIKKLGLTAKMECPIKVKYDNVDVGDYFADILVENCIIVELKSVKALTERHRAQLSNYLCATNIEVGLLINFGENIEIKRAIFDNERKTIFRKDKKERKVILGTDKKDKIGL